MAQLKFLYTTHVDFHPAVGRHNLLLRCLPAIEAFQTPCREDFCISAPFHYRLSHDGLGNRILTACTDTPHHQLDYTCQGIIQCTTYCIPDAHPHPMYRLPSRLTAPTSDMRSLLPHATGHFLTDCLQLTHNVHSHIVYTPGVTGMLTTAADTLLHRQGVCQDYAHLMLALCHMVGWPARYVCGLISGQGQTHAWVEVHDGQCWYAFDPTNDTAVATGYIKLAHGRDACDCPVSRGIYQGLAQEHTYVNVTVTEI